MRVVAAVAAMVLAACTPTPSASGPATTPGASPIASAAIAPNVFGSNWARVEFGGKDVDARAAAYGRSGLVIVGAGCVGSGDSPECTAAAWHRTLDGVWKPSSVEDPAGATISDVVFAGRYVALGTRIEDQGLPVRAIIWTSDDGAAWTLVGSVEIGDCSGEGPPCGHAEQLTVTPGGLILIGDVYAAGRDAYSGALRSVDAMHWARVPPKAFGDDDASLAAALPVGNGVVALVSSGQSPLTAWRSTDGASWTRFSGFGELAQSRGALAGNEQLLVAAEGESAPEGFRTTMWTSADGGPFQQRAAFDDVAAAKVVDTGSTGFVAVGDDEGRPQVIVSPDGVAWSRVGPGLPQIECSALSLAGGSSEALYIGSCGVWATHEP
jgi:hypothetical protein